jgi:hypothetical protein
VEDAAPYFAHVGTITKIPRNIQSPGRWIQPKRSGGHVEPGARVITDGWQGYRGLEKLGYVHDRRSRLAARAGGEDSGELQPAVHRALDLAVAHPPVRYEDPIATKRPRAVPPAPPQARGHPPSLERPPANRPWRTADLGSSG